MIHTELRNLQTNNTNLSSFGGNLFGVYRARVEDNKDPSGSGRVRVRVPKFHGTKSSGLQSEDLPWATLCSSSAGFNYGSYMVPEVGEYVMVVFEDGDSSKPVCVGSIYGKGSRSEKEYVTGDDDEWESSTGILEVPEDAQRESPTKKILYKSPKTAEFSIDESKGNETVCISDSLGQCIQMVSPNDCVSSYREERIPDSSSDSKITLKGLGGQYLELSTSNESNDVSVDIVSRECAITLKPSDTGISINSNNACITLDKDGNITLSGKSVSIRANEDINISTPENIGIYGKNVTIGYNVTLMEGDSVGDGSSYVGEDTYSDYEIDLDTLMKLEDVDTSNWLEVVKAVKQAMANGSGKYNNSGIVNIKINGKVISARTDCSGFVSACLNAYGSMSGKKSSSQLTALSSLSGFTKLPFNGTTLKAGDILVKNGHTEIYSHSANGKSYIYNYGSSSSAAATGATRGGGTFTYIFRPNGSLD